MYVYFRSEPNLWTVGYYEPSGTWISESDWDTKQEAAARVNYLNGAGFETIEKRLAALESIINHLRPN